MKKRMVKLLVLTTVLATSATVATPVKAENNNWIPEGSSEYQIGWDNISKEQDKKIRKKHMDEAIDSWKPEGWNPEAEGWKEVADELDNRQNSSNTETAEEMKAQEDAHGDAWENWAKEQDNKTPGTDKKST